MERKILDFSNQETFVSSHSFFSGRGKIQLSVRVSASYVLFKKFSVTIAPGLPFSTEASHLTQQPIRVLMKTNSNKVSRR